MPKFEPLTLDLIEEGRFKDDINHVLGEIQKEHIEHVKKYGKEVTKKSKSAVKITISVQFEGRDENDFSIKGSIRKETPGRPPVVTSAISDSEQDGMPCLFVRRSGSTEDSPKQGVLTTKEGNVVDPKTGEVKKK